MCLPVFILIWDGRKKYMSVSLWVFCSLWFALCKLFIIFSVKCLILIRSHCVFWGHFVPYVYLCDSKCSNSVWWYSENWVNSFQSIYYLSHYIYIYVIYKKNIVTFYTYTYLLHFYNIQVALWLFFCQDELWLGNDDFSSEVALSGFQLLTSMCYLLSASHGYFSHPPQYWAMLEN